MMNVPPQDDLAHHANPKHEKDEIVEALSRHHGNLTQASRDLGMHRTTLWRKLVAYHLD